MEDIMKYDCDVQISKRAILDSQYRAAKEVNGYQLTLRYAIGGHISDKT